MGGASSVGRKAEPKSQKVSNRDNRDKKSCSSSNATEAENGDSSVATSTQKTPRSLKNKNYLNGEGERDRDENTLPCDPYSSINSHEQSYQDSPRVNDEYSESQARMDEDIFAHTAMSLEMDNDDLLFNLLYFENNAANLGQVLNNVQEETVALHSDNNTPYKLRPASQIGLANLITEDFTDNSEDKERECAICKDDIEYGDAITRIRSCKHYFHKECLIRWAKLQGWCPVCRASIDESSTAETNDRCEHFGSDSRSPDIDECNESKAGVYDSDISATLQRKETQDLKSNFAKSEVHYDKEMEMDYDEVQDNTRIIASSMTDMYPGTTS